MTSASTTNQQNAVFFWEDDSMDLHASRLRKNVPALPRVTDPLQVVYGGSETIAFCALQVLKSKDKLVIVRAIASAVASLFSIKENLTGSPTPAIPLTGLDGLIDDDASRTGLVTTNFDEESPVTLGEIDALLAADIDELGYYFGVLCYAAGKAINEKNQSAFNEKRVNSVDATITEEKVIFVPESPYFAMPVIRKVYAAFNAYLPLRAHLFSRVANRMDQVQMGPTAAFATMFILTQDNGMGALRIIKEAMMKHEWIRTEFPELRPEISAANEGIRSIQRAVASDRPFLKIIHGSAYVPVAYSSIGNLTGICKHILVQTTPTYANYGGGKLTDAQEAKVNRLLQEHGHAVVTHTATVQQENAE